MAASGVGILISVGVLVDSARVAVYLLGFALQLTGITVALHGLVGVSAELFPGRRLPHQVAATLIRRWLHIRPRSKGVVVGVAAINAIAVVMSAHGVATRGRPSDAAPASEWHAYWDSQIAALSSRVDRLKDDARKSSGELRQLVSDETTARAEATARLEERLKTVVGGEAGAGLAETW